MFKKKLRTLALLTAALAGVLASASVTQANSIQISGVTTSQTAGVWEYSYSMSLTANNSISASNPNGSSMFIFYDFNGLTGTPSFTAGATATTDWNIVVENTSGTWAAGQSTITAQGGNAVETDSAIIPNVRFQYVGTGFAPTSTAALGTANIYSTNAPGLYGQYAARWIGISGETEINTQSPLMPVPTAGATSTPLPSALWMGVTSIVGLALVARARRRAR